MRIVSLLPSATDIVEALGARDHLVGISHSCDVRRLDLPVLTGTVVDTNAHSAAIDQQVRSAGGPLYQLDFGLLFELQPDVVISQSLCDVCAVGVDDVERAVQALSSQPIVVNLAPFRMNDVLTDVAQVGQAIGCRDQAVRLSEQWHQHISQLPKLGLKVAFLDWLEPPFAAGHWVPDLLTQLGCESVLAQPGQPSRQVTWQQVREAQADVVVAACCGLTAQRALQDQVPDDLKVHVLDGYHLFSRPSPALLPSLDALAELSSGLS